MFANLTALCRGFGVGVEELHKRGDLVPSMLLYKAVADVWDNIFDPLIAAGVENVDPVGLLYAPKDAGEDENLVSCSDKFNPINIKKVQAALLQRVFK